MPNAPRICGARLLVGGFETRCVLDRGHSGPCKSYAQVLKLDLPTECPADERR